MRNLCIFLFNDLKSNEEGASVDIIGSQIEIYRKKEDMRTLCIFCVNCQQLFEI